MCISTSTARIFNLVLLGHQSTPSQRMTQTRYLHKFCLDLFFLRIVHASKVAAWRFLPHLSLSPQQKRLSSFFIWWKDGWGMDNASSSVVVAAADLMIWKQGQGQVFYFWRRSWSRWNSQAWLSEIGRKNWEFCFDVAVCVWEREDWMKSKGGLILALSCWVINVWWGLCESRTDHPWERPFCHLSFA